MICWRSARSKKLGQLSAWGWDAYHKELESPQDTIMLVARVDSVVYGFELGGFIVARLIAGELHVNNVAVRAELRRIVLIELAGAHAASGSTIWREGSAP